MVLYFASWCSHSFTNLQGVHGYFTDMLLCANDNKLCFAIIQS